MNQYTLLVVGILIGSAVVAGIMGMLNSFKARRLRKENARREDIISSVEGNWIDVESIVSSFRSGRLSPQAFREAVNGKIETISRLYKPGIHQLDIFFVKYTEKVIEEYRRMTAPAEISPAVPMAAPAADVALPAAAPVAGPAVDLQPPLPAAKYESPEPPSEIAFPTLDDDLGISESAEAAAKDSNLQLESFLEMEPANFDVGSVVPIEETGIVKTDDLIPQEPPVTPEGKDRFEDRGQLPPLQDEAFGAPQSQVGGPGAKSSLDEESFLPPPPADIDTAGPDITESETIIQPSPDRFSFSGRVTSGQNFEPVPLSPQDMPPPPPSQERSQPYSSPSAPAFTRDEVVQPATIFDLEAETIIVDRNTIMDHPGVGEQKDGDKKSIGITGEDVSDTFDKFFGLAK